MSQVLNVEIVSERKLLANCYMHSSGFTGSAMRIGTIIIEKIAEIGCKINTPKLAVNLLKKSLDGALPDEGTIKMLKLPKNSDILSKNNGIISATEEGMKNTRYDEESRITIDTINKTVVFNNWSLYDLSQALTNNRAYESLKYCFQTRYDIISRKKDGKITLCDYKTQEIINNVDLDFDVKGEISFENFIKLVKKYENEVYRTSKFRFTINNKYFVGVIE